MRIPKLTYVMPRLNIYIPDEIHRLAAKWRGTLNLSEVCVGALREELEAAELGRKPGPLLRNLQPRTKTEQALLRRYKLHDARVVAVSDDLHMRDELGDAAATFIEQTLGGDCLIGVAGGRQMWAVVRALSPRLSRTTLTALGIGQVDPLVLHAHPNTLVTLLWLLHSPRAKAHLVGASATTKLWDSALERRSGTDIRSIVIGSCSVFDEKSPLASLLGVRQVRALVEGGAKSEFAYTFLDHGGHPVEWSAPAPSSRISASNMKHLAERKDARVVLVAGGEAKKDSIRLVLKARLCNTLITDSSTAQYLMT